MGIKFYCYAAIVALVLIFLYYFRHDIIKAEDDKVTLATQNAILKVEDKKNEIRNTPITDKRTADRLLHGTYFNH